jgi:hypothetical protein
MLQTYGLAAVFAELGTDGIEGATLVTERLAGG